MLNSSDYAKNYASTIGKSLSETQGQLVGTGKSLKRAKKIRAKKSQEREEELVKSCSSRS